MGKEKANFFIDKPHAWYNPHSIEGRKVEKFLFFDKNGVICETKQGWFTVEEVKRNDGSMFLFETSNNPHSALTIEDLDSVNTHKFKPELHKAQIIRIVPRYNFEKAEKPINVYILYDVMDFEVLINHNQVKSTLKTYHYDLYWSKKYKVGFYSDSKIHETPNIEEVELWNKVKPLYELLTGKVDNYPPYGFSSNLEKIKVLAERL